MHQVIWKNRPRLRFIEPATPPEGTPGVVTPVTGPDGLPVADPAPAGDPKDDEKDPEDLGFPQGVPREQMTVDQREAFWKNQARQHEREAKAAKKKLEEAAAAADEAAKTDEQRREDALRAEGQVMGAQPFIRQAIRAELRAETGLKAEEIDEVFRFADPDAFLKDGAIDPAAITAFASRFKVPAATDKPLAPTSVLAGLSGSSAPRGGTTTPEGGSLADKKKAARERLEKGRGRGSK